MSAQTENSQNRALTRTGPQARYDALVASGDVDPDPAQAEAMARLETLSRALVARGRGGLLSRLPFARTRTPPRGLYLWGGVGRGKSLLMDIFFNNTAAPAKRRAHFHEFMADAHERIAAWRAADDSARRRHKAYNRKSPDDPIPLVAADIAEDAMLLCFDEFQVTDIADAMILGRLFEAMFDRGVVMVATSNRHPDDLYKDGLNRQLFLPSIELLKTRLEVWELAADRDYRLARLEGAPVYHAPLGPETDAAMDAAFARMICGATPARESVRVKGRSVEVPRAARGAARFSFADLCDAPLGASDYLAVTQRYAAIFVDHIPVLTPARRDAAKRFVTLIDAVYESRTKLVCSADARPEDLYPEGDGAFEFERTVSRLMEMQSADYLSAEHAYITDMPAFADDGADQKADGRDGGESRSAEF